MKSRVSLIIWIGESTRLQKDAYRCLKCSDSFFRAYKFICSLLLITIVFIKIGWSSIIFQHAIAKVSQVKNVVNHFYIILLKQKSIYLFITANMYFCLIVVINCTVRLLEQYTGISAVSGCGAATSLSVTINLTR